jgi:hypothetical protein
MSAAKYTFTFEQGTTIDVEMLYKSSGSNTPIDLTGYGAKMQIKSNYADNKPRTFLTLSSSLNADNTGLTLGGTSGSIRLFVSAATSSAALNFDTAFYDLEITTSTGIVTRLLEGPVKIKREVTR